MKNDNACDEYVEPMQKKQPKKAGWVGEMTLGGDPNNPFPLGKPKKAGIEWEKELISLLEKQGLSPNDPNDEASQQIYFEDKKFISQLLHSQKQSITEAVEKIVKKRNIFDCPHVPGDCDCDSQTLDEILEVMKKI
jgi:hypothetical protein